MRQHTLKFLAAFASVALFAGIGCSTSAPARPETPEQPVYQPPQPVAPVAAPEPSKPVTFQAANPEMEKIIQEVARNLPDRTCACKDTLKTAIVTDPKVIPAATRERLAMLLKDRLPREQK